MLREGGGREGRPAELRQRQSRTWEREDGRGERHGLASLPLQDRGSTRQARGGQAAEHPRKKDRRGWRPGGGRCWRLEAPHPRECPHLPLSWPSRLRIRCWRVGGCDPLRGPPRRRSFAALGSPAHLSSGLGPLALSATDRRWSSRLPLPTDALVRSTTTHQSLAETNERTHTSVSAAPASPPVLLLPEHTASPLSSPPVSPQLYAMADARSAVAVAHQKNQKTVRARRLSLPRSAPPSPSARTHHSPSRPSVSRLAYTSAPPLQLFPVDARRTVRVAHSALPRQSASLPCLITPQR